MNERQQETADRIREEAPGEILRLEFEGDGFHVVQKLPEDPHPELYRVILEKHLDGSESLHWTLLGTADEFDRE